jgi:hypothetical protein
MNYPQAGHQNASQQKRGQRSQQKKGGDMLHAVVYINNTARVIGVEEAILYKGPFFCHQCGTRVIFRQAGTLPPHFTHFVNLGCQPDSYPGGVPLFKTECRPDPQPGDFPQRLPEEIALMLAKEPAVSALHQGWLGTRRMAPALDFWWEHRQQIAIEVALGSLPVETISRRTRRHTQAGMAVLWVVPWKHTFEDGNICVPMEHERYLHELYRGRLFTWSQEQRLCPIFYQRLKRSSAVLKRFYKTQRFIASEASISRVYREVRVHPPVALADLQVISYPVCKSRRMLLPAATLWTDAPEPGHQQEGGHRREVDG